MPELPLSKVIDIDDFVAPELEPYLREIDEQAAARSGAGTEDFVPDARQWQGAFALRAMVGAGARASSRMIAGIGAGTDATIFALARRGFIVFAVDRYLDRGARSDAAPAAMLIDPARYSTAEIPRGSVIPVHSAATRLNLPDESFDGVFCAEALGRLGSLESVAAASREIGRILKPGGVASIAVELRLDGPADCRWFDDDMMLFTPRLLERYIIEPSGLQLRDPIRFTQSERTFETRHNLVDFPRRAHGNYSFDEKRAVPLNLVLYHDGFLFCPVVLTLHKDTAARLITGAEPETMPVGEKNAVAVAEREYADLARELETFQRDPGGAPPVPQVRIGELQQLQAENERLRQDLAGAMAWKHSKVMRPFRFVYRRLKRWNV